MSEILTQVPELEEFVNDLVGLAALGNMEADKILSLMVGDVLPVPDSLSMMVTMCNLVLDKPMVDNLRFVNPTTEMATDVDMRTIAYKLRSMIEHCDLVVHPMM